MSYLHASFLDSKQLESIGNAPMGNKVKERPTHEADSPLDEGSELALLLQWSFAGLVWAVAKSTTKVLIKLKDVTYES